MDAIETLKALRAKKSALYDSIQGDIQRLEMESRELAAEIVGVDEAIKAISGAAKNEQAGQPALPAIGKYSNMSPTLAILDVVQKHGNPPGLLVPDIIAKLAAEGFKSKAEQLYSVVYAISQRLVKQDKIREGRRDGKRAFMRKEPF